MNRGQAGLQLGLREGSQQDTQVREKLLYTSQIVTWASHTLPRRLEALVTDDACLV